MWSRWKHGTWKLTVTAVTAEALGDIFLFEVEPSLLTEEGKAAGKYFQGYLFDQLADQRYYDSF